MSALNVREQNAGITYTVGTYSPGKLSVVYEINMHVLPTVPSPTTTHFIGLPEDIFSYCKLEQRLINKDIYRFWRHIVRSK